MVSLIEIETFGHAIQLAYVEPAKSLAPGVVNFFELNDGFV
jgi:hypothetical protein